MIRESVTENLREERIGKEKEICVFWRERVCEEHEEGVLRQAGYKK